MKIAETQRLQLRLLALQDVEYVHDLRRLGFRFVPNQQADPQSGSVTPGLIGILDSPGQS